jgi:hypothetical protein
MLEGRGAEDVGEQQHALARIDQLHHLAGQRQGVERIVLAGDAELGDLRRALVEHVAGALDEGFAQAAVGDEKNADHDRLGVPKRL